MDIGQKNSCDLTIVVSEQRPYQPADPSRKLGARLRHPTCVNCRCTICETRINIGINGPVT